jgi:hypothetical protein
VDHTQSFVQIYLLILTHSVRRPQFSHGQLSSMLHGPSFRASSIFTVKGPPTALSHCQNGYLPQSARNPRQYVHGPGTHTSSAGILVLFPGARFLHSTTSQRGIWRELRSRSVQRRGNNSPARNIDMCAGAFCASRKTLNTLDIFY